MEDNKIELRPYIYNCCEAFTFELCQEQGWFEDKKLSDLTKDDKKEVYWLNNWQIAVRSYLFWSEAIS